MRADFRCSSESDESDNMLRANLSICRRKLPGSYSPETMSRFRRSKTLSESFHFEMRSELLMFVSRLI